MFYSTLGHVEANWDRAEMQPMIVEAIKMGAQARRRRRHASGGALRSRGPSSEVYVQAFPGWPPGVD